jgi:hypothetical protein
MEIYVYHHDAGLINQLMSLELVSGLAFMLKKQIHVIKPYYKTNQPVCLSGNQYKILLDFELSERHPIILDLIDYDFECLRFTKNIDSEIVFDKTLISNWYSCKERLFDQDEIDFADGREHLNFVEDNNYGFAKFNFGFYSRFFHARTQKLDNFLNKIDFKKEYWDLAKKIANSLDSFAGIHLRGSDHRKNFNIKNEELEFYIQNYHNSNKKVVLCTDEDIEQIPNTILLHEYIVENFWDEFVKLEYNSILVFSLINLLVMTYSDYFIGTPGSTYTAYIHRKLYQKRNHNFEMMDCGRYHSSWNQSGKYSWNGMPMHTEMKSWWREWPESKLNVVS